MSFSGFGQREAVRSGRNPCIVSLTVIRSFRCPGISDERISQKTLERRVSLKKKERRKRVEGGGNGGRKKKRRRTERKERKGKSDAGGKVDAACVVEI